MTGTSINLKSLLRSVTYLRRQVLERLADIEDRVLDALGKEAYLVDDMFDYERLHSKFEGPYDGRHLSAELLQRIYQDNARYMWHYQDATISIQPIREGTEKGFYCFAEPSINTFITFNSMTQDLTDFETTSIWEVAEARITGFADGYISATQKKLSKDLSYKAYVEGKAMEKVAGLGGMKVEDEDGRTKCEFLKPSVDDIIGEGRLGPVGHPDPAGEPQCDGTYYGG